MVLLGGESVPTYLSKQRLPDTLAPIGVGVTQSAVNFCATLDTL